MEARNRLLPEWFERVRTRQISLPRFQRMVVWGPNEVAGLLTTVLRGLPGGATLILEVGDKLPFISRTMVDAPDDGERITELLLDGQQRLTALWRSLNGTFEDRTYLVEFEDDPHSPGKKQPSVFGLSRWVRKGQLYPLWADKPQELWERGYIPMRLLRPGDATNEIDNWVEEVVGDNYKAGKEIDRTIADLRFRVAQFNLPFLSLPVGTPKDVALDVFIKMNTSSVALSTFDIIVAQVESAADESLHDLVAKLMEQVPAAAEYKNPDDLILDVAALMQDRTPNQAGYAGLDLERMIAEWDALIENIRRMTEFLEGEAIYDNRRLPTDAVLALLAGLCHHLPKNPDQLGNAKTMMRKYLWRACFTNRYDRAAATAAINDFRALRDVLQGKKTESEVPIFNEQLHALPAEEQLVSAGWPKNRNTLARAILALSLKAGGRDIADDATVTRQHLKQREYHHLFPASTLLDAGLKEEEVYRALNCALITWRTNRKISNKDPVDYLRDRAEANSLGADDLDRRLRSHLIAPQSLNVGGYAQLDSDSRRDQITADYHTFLVQRAKVISQLVQHVCEGKELDALAVTTAFGNAVGEHSQ